MLARIKPYDPKKGHLLRGMSIPQLRGARFVEGRWMDLAPLAKTLGKSEAEIAAVLKTIHQDPTNESTPAAFDVATSADAQRLADDELREQIRGAPPLVSAEPPKLSPPEKAPTPPVHGPRAPGGNQHRGNQKGGR